MLAADRWDNTCRDKQVVVFTDSIVTKVVVNKDKCCNSLVVEYLHRLFWLPLMSFFSIRAVHLPGSVIDIPESSSRLQEEGQVLQLVFLLQHWFHDDFSVQ